MCSTTGTSIDERMGLFHKYLERSRLEYKDYQFNGVKWCINNELRTCNVRGGFIADEMGLGKTIIMIGTFVSNFLPKTLIVLPPILLDQWLLQIYKTTGHTALLYHGANKKNITQEDLNKAIIVITTYSEISIARKKVKNSGKNVKCSILHEIKWDRIVFDEAHHLRNANTSRYIGAKKLSAKIKWLVSGTPIQNKKADLYNLCSLIGIPASFYTENSNLILLARSFILKRTKKQVGIEISEIIHDKNIVQWKNSSEMRLSKEIHSELSFSKIKYNTNLNQERSRNVVLTTLNKGSVLSLILNARQICIYPKLVYKQIDNSFKKGIFKDRENSFYKEAFNSSSKLDSVIADILERKGNGNGKLIFCHFREEIDEISSRLIAGGIKNVVSFDGRTSHSKRMEILHGNNEVLILQIQTGCEGLNLQENYSEIYFVSPHWNPAVEDQAIARCHRIGQKKPVFVKRFEMSSFHDEETSVTCDNYINSVQNSKREIINEYMK
jgi:SNF2 family DNA or RNA helicase